MAKNVRFKIKKKLCVCGRGRSAIKKGGLYESICHTRHFKIFCKGVHRYYMTENVGFRCFIYVLRMALTDVITYIEDTITYSDELTIPVFQLKDLTELYKKQIILYGAATKDTKYDICSCNSIKKLNTRKRSLFT